jgi:IPT/TIG domain
MNRIRQHRLLLAFFTLLFVLAGCKGESPTAPNLTPSGGTPPPTSTGGSTGTAITLSVTNPTPLVGSVAIVTATVSVNGSPAANGTAVEFSVTTPGVFTDTNVGTTLRTTTSGVSTASVTSSSATSVTVTARVGAIFKTVVITFGASSTPTPGTTTAVITDINPKTGKPDGGDTIVISGKNFKEPARVFFTTAAGRVEGFVSSVTSTAITVITPKITLGTSVQKVDATVTVIIGAGTSTEAQLTAPVPFTYQLEILIPVIHSVAPTSGAKEGGTQIVIFGEGFQFPVQVSFGTGGGSGGTLTAAADLKVISVTFDKIVAITPPFVNTDTAAANGQVTLRVYNLNSNKDAVLAQAFRYTPKLLIIAFGPNEGPFTGGTKVTIDGQGFEDPVVVTIGGVAALPIRVSGSEIVAVTDKATVLSCTDVVGPVIVTNITTQETATTTATFTYRVPKPIVLSVTPTANPGGMISITVRGAFGFPRLQIGDQTVIPTGTTTNPDGTTTFTVAVPLNLTLTQTPCLAGGQTPIPTQFDITYTSADTGCTATFPKALTVNPPTTAGSGKIFFNPAGFTPFTSTFVAFVPALLVAPFTPVVPAHFTPSPTQVIQLVNNGSGPLTINSVSQSAGCSAFNIGLPAPLPILQPCDPLAVTASFAPPPPANPLATTGTANGSCTLTFNTDAGNRSLTLSGTAQ